MRADPENQTAAPTTGIIGNGGNEEFNKEIDLIENLVDRQAARLLRRFSLQEPTARVVAFLAFDTGVA